MIHRCDTILLEEGRGVLSGKFFYPHEAEKPAAVRFPSLLFKLAEDLSDGLQIAIAPAKVREEVAVFRPLVP